MQPTLPPPDYTGRTPAEKLAEGPALEYNLHPARLLKTELRSVPRLKPGRAMFASPAEARRIALGLLKLKAVTVLRRHQLLKCADKPLVQGTFGTPKGKLGLLR